MRKKLITGLVIANTGQMAIVKTTFQRLLFLGIILMLSTSVVLCQTSNNRSEIVNGSGNVIQKSISLSPFRSIQIDNYKVYLIQDTLYEVRISGEDNIIEEIDLISENGVLTSQFGRRIKLKNKEPIEVFVHFIDLAEINAENAEYVTIGSITADSLQVTSTTSEFDLEIYVKTLRVDLSGNGFDRGVLSATGNADSCNVFLAGKASFDSPKLTGDNFFITYGQRSFYRIKKSNFRETNVNSSTNSMQRLGNNLMNVLSFLW